MSKGDEFDAINSKINDLLMELASKNITVNGNICTGWFIVTEWMDSESKYQIVGWGDGSNAPWKYDGMLNYALTQELAYENDDVEED